ncbi:hypothetical protein LTR70_007204 [Exophiala xenobiotica]|nr:hypothetical protein LTR70_007204 [Exophiala xenobiotica]
MREQDRATSPCKPNSKAARSPAAVVREEPPYRVGHLETLQDIEAEMQRAEHKRAVAESKKKQAMAMLEEAERLEREAANERRSACTKRIEVLEKLKAQAIEDSWESGDYDPQPLPRSSAHPSQLPPIIIDRTDDDLEMMTTRSRRASSAISPMNKTRRSSSSTASTETMSSSRCSKKAKLRGGGSDYDVLELHRRARPRTIWGGPAWG